MVSKEQKATLVKKYGANDKDSGAVEVQVAILTADILQLTEHLKAHTKDVVTRRSLLKKVEHRKRLLKYLKKSSVDDYTKLIKQLKLRK